MITALHGEVAGEDARVTPELALVDPVLAATERVRLPELEDTLSRLVSVSMQPRPLQPSLPLYATVSTAPPEIDPGLVQVQGRSSRLTSIDWNRVVPTRVRGFGVPAAPRFVGALIIVSVAIGAVLSIEVFAPDVGAPPASVVNGSMRNGSSSASVLPGSLPKTAAQRPAHQSRNSREHTEQQPQPATSPRRFAWAPAARATGYHVELFRGGSKVFSADTLRPQLTVPARWKHAGKMRSLHPGEYRWYVWATVSGTRATRAIVQARLVVAAR